MYLVGRVGLNCVCLSSVHTCFIRQIVQYSVQSLFIWFGYIYPVILKVIIIPIFCSCVCTKFASATCCYHNQTFKTAVRCYTRQMTSSVLWKLHLDIILLIPESGSSIDGILLLLIQLTPFCLKIIYLVLVHNTD